MRRGFLLLGLTVLLCGSVTATTIARRSRAADHKASASSPVYEKWLSEDVVYIITPEEKRAFLLLKTDEEREHFIEAFWRRRDTSLDTQDNEFRAEHYERIAHANQNFASGAVAGWRTDRGRIYITHGKPDLVRKTATGEVWTYKHLPGTGGEVSFEFVAPAGTGDLRLRQ